MTVYYFDTRADGHTQVDADGIETDRAGLYAKAIEALPSMAADEIVRGEARTVIVRVRDAGGKHVLHASLSLVLDEFD